MKSTIQKEIAQLLQAKVIDAETADRLEHYYQQQRDSGSNRILIVFGILGSILAGLGIIMLLAHNWDDLHISIKTMIAFLPLLVGQAGTLFGYLKKRQVWLEGAATFLFFGTIASISLIAQIYNISGGDFADFILAIFLLNLPIVYLCGTRSTAMLSVVAITCHGCAEGYNHGNIPYLYWIGLLALLPHMYMLYKQNPNGNFYRGMLWLLTLSFAICFATLFPKVDEEIVVLSYFYAALAFGALADLKLFRTDTLFANPFKVIGVCGYLLMLFIFTFDDFWSDLIRYNSITASEWMIVVCIGAVGVAINVVNKFRNGYNLTLIGLSAMCIIAANSEVWVAVAIANIIVLFVSIYHIIVGHKQDHLGILNVGLLILLTLISLRYFDWELSFVVKGILFLVLGAGFFVANYLFVKNRKSKQHHE